MDLIYVQLSFGRIIERPMKSYISFSWKDGTSFSLSIIQVKVIEECFSHLASCGIVYADEENIFHVLSLNQFFGNHDLVLFAIFTSVNIIGTSTRTPTIVASTTGEVGPNKEIATATASSKKFDAPIIPAGAAIL